MPQGMEVLFFHGKRQRPWEQLTPGSLWQGRNLDVHIIQVPSRHLNFQTHPLLPQNVRKEETNPEPYHSGLSRLRVLAAASHTAITAQSWLVSPAPSYLSSCRFAVASSHQPGAAPGRGCLTFPITLHVACSIMGHLAVFDSELSFSL